MTRPLPRASGPRKETPSLEDRHPLVHSQRLRPGGTHPYHFHGTPSETVERGAASHDDRGPVQRAPQPHGVDHPDVRPVRRPRVRRRRRHRGAGHRALREEQGDRPRRRRGRRGRLLRHPHPLRPPGRRERPRPGHRGTHRRHTGHHDRHRREQRLRHRRVDPETGPRHQKHRAHQAHLGVSPGGRDRAGRDRVAHCRYIAQGSRGGRTPPDPRRGTAASEAEAGHPHHEPAGRREAVPGSAAGGAPEHRARSRLQTQRAARELRAAPDSDPRGTGPARRVH